MFNVSLYHSKIGDIRLDAVITEQGESTLSISDNPIESGAVITDHVALQPKEVSIEGIVIEQAWRSDTGNSVTAPLRSVKNFLDEVAGVVPSADILGVSTAALNDVLMGAEKGQGVQASISEKTAFLHGVMSGQKIDSTTIQSRPQKVYQALLDLQQHAEPITIETRLKTYSNMLIASLAVSESPTGEVLFSITAREVVIVNTHTVSGDGLIGEQKSGRAGIQAQANQDTGHSQAQEAEPKRKSMLRWLADDD